MATRKNSRRLIMCAAVACVGMTGVEQASAQYWRGTGDPLDVANWTDGTRWGNSANTTVAAPGLNANAAIFFGDRQQNVAFNGGTTILNTNVGTQSQLFLGSRTGLTPNNTAQSNTLQVDTGGIINVQSGLFIGRNTSTNQTSLVEGILNIDGGTVTSGSTTNLGEAANSRGTLTLTNGTWTQNGGLNVGAFTGATTQGGTGVVNLNGGTFTGAGAWILGSGQSGIGTVNIGAGATVSGSRSLNIASGTSSQGTVTQSGSAANYTSMNIGSGSNSTSTYNLNGGSFSLTQANTFMTVGNSGVAQATLNSVAGTTITATNNAFNIGGNTTNESVWNTAGTVNWTNNWTTSTIGSSGRAALLQTAGDFTITGGNATHNVGSTSQALGRWEVTGGTMNANSSPINIANNAALNFNPDLSANTNGRVLVSGASTSWTSGAVSVGSGSTSRGELTVSNGATMTVNGTLNVSVNGGDSVGVVVVDNATLNASSTLNFFNSSGRAANAVNIRNGGTLRSTGGSASINQSGQVTVEATGGTFRTASEISLNSSARLNNDGGSVITDSGSLNLSSSARFTQTAGTSTFNNGSITLNNSSQFLLSGGTVNATNGSFNATAVGPTFSLTGGGTLNVSTLNWFGISDGQITHNNGTINVANAWTGTSNDATNWQKLSTVPLEAGDNFNFTGAANPTLPVTRDLELNGGRFSTNGTLSFTNATTSRVDGEGYIFGTMSGTTTNYVPGPDTLTLASNLTEARHVHMHGGTVNVNAALTAPNFTTRTGVFSNNVAGIVNVTGAVSINSASTGNTASTVTVGGLITAGTFNSLGTAFTNDSTISTTTGSLVVNHTGAGNTITLNAPLTSATSVAVNGDTVLVNPGAVLTSTSNGSVTLAGRTQITVDEPITGFGAFNLLRDGAVTNPNVTLNTPVVNDGSVTLTNVGNVTINAEVTPTSGSFSSTGTGTWNNTSAVPGEGVLVIPGSVNVVHSGNVTVGSSINAGTTALISSGGVTNLNQGQAINAPTSLTVRAITTLNVNEPIITDINLNRNVGNVSFERASGGGAGPTVNINSEISPSGFVAFNNVGPTNVNQNITTPTNFDVTSASGTFVIVPNKTVDFENSSQITSGGALDRFWVRGSLVGGDDSLLTVNHRRFDVPLNSLVSVDTMVVEDNGVINMTGGKLSLEALDVITNSNSRFNFFSGELEVKGSGVNNANIEVIGGTDLFKALGNSLTVKPGQKLTILGNTDLISQLDINGGTFETRTLTQAQQLKLTTGQFDLQDQSINVGPGGTFGSGPLLIGPNMVVNINGATNTATVSAGGQLVLSGGELNVANTFTNNNQVNITGVATLRTGNGFTNNNQIILSNPLGRITGGSITNTASARIVGSGQIEVPVSNTGEIRSQFTDVLTFTSAVTSTGTLRVINGGTQVFDAGLSSSGTMNGDGSFVTGQATAFSIAGTTGSVIRNNGGLLNFGGKTDFFGDVVLNNTPSITTPRLIASGGATVSFYDDVLSYGFTRIRAGADSKNVFFGQLKGHFILQSDTTGKNVIEGSSSGWSPTVFPEGGNLQLSASASREFDISGTVPATFADIVGGQYNNRYSVAGDLGIFGGAGANLFFEDGATIIVNLTSTTWDSGLNPTGPIFSPSLGDSFVLWTYSTVTGNNGVAFNLPALTGGLHWATNWTGNSTTAGALTLSVVVPEPTSLALLGLGVCGLLRRTRRAK